MNYPLQHTQRGFVALMMVITLSFVLTGFALATSTSGVRARLSINTIEDAWIAAHRARACAAIALLYLAQDETSDLEEVLPKTFSNLPETNCEVLEVEQSNARALLWILGKEGVSTHGARFQIILSPTEAPKIEQRESL